MNIKTIEEKAKRYDELFVKAKQIYNKENDVLILHTIEDLFPSLKESEDERMRKVAIEACKYMVDNFENSTKQYEDAIAWLEKQGKNSMGISEATKQKLEDNLNKALEKETPESFNEFLEKQGEQNPTDKVEPKYHEGDWVIIDGETLHITNVTEDGYSTKEGGHIPFRCEKEASLWTIQDAKDGDILATLDYILIFKECLKEDGGVSYCHYDFGAGNPQFIYTEDNNWYFGKEAIVYPATKEQRDLLFAEMKDAGYEWDANKKELKKIEEKSAWSEEDEKMWSQVINEIEAIKSNSSTVFEKNIAQGKIDFLKSLKDRYTWQPSEEQMKVCKEVYADILSAKGFDLGTVNSELNRMEEELKKLKEA